MLVMGIDPGTASTGYGLVRENQDGSLSAVDFGVISTPSSSAMPERLLQLFNALQEILHHHSPHCGAVEKLYFSRNVKTAMSVGQARGVALLALAKGKIPAGEYTPREIKQAVVGYGNADKKQVQEMVKAILGLDELPQPDDAADALAVAICHIHSRQDWLKES
ncbi:MAG: crossover junction endodeoxyribonuclease RuvC [Anaerolineales bacterium]|nr:crossover junction endodeoxyribonuclease RuvC [Anaerolineales bacterium]